MTRFTLKANITIYTTTSTKFTTTHSTTCNNLQLKKNIHTLNISNNCIILEEGIVRKLPHKSDHFMDAQDPPSLTVGWVLLHEANTNLF